MNIHKQHGSILIFIVVAIAILTGASTVSYLIMSNNALTKRRLASVQAYEYADAGAIMALRHLSIAFKDSSNGEYGAKLTSPSGGFSAYTYDSLALNYSNLLKVHGTDQWVDVVIHVPNDGSERATIKSTATFRDITKQVKLHVGFTYQGVKAVLWSEAVNENNGAPTGDGDNKKFAHGNEGRNGHIVFATDKLIIDGDVMANGKVVGLNANDYSFSQNLAQNAETKLPNYTTGDERLFDFERYIALSEKMGQRIVGIENFRTALAGGNTLEGVVTLVLTNADLEGDKADIDFPIRVNGSLVFDFESDWNYEHKVVLSEELVVNQAGYPPIYSDSSKQPWHPDNSLSADGFEDFKEADDLPAVMYRNSLVDIHGDETYVHGVLYSPFNAELESHDTTYRGAVICGNGIYVKDDNVSFIYDKNTFDNLATQGRKGHDVTILYRE